LKKILIIDDDQDNLFILAECLKIKGVEVIAKSTIIPIEEIIQISPDLILLDHWISDMKGGDFCFEIKNDDSTAHIPVILISAIIDLEDVAVKSCADSHIEKPFDIDDLQKEVKRFLPLDVT
jgi:CheY-like chemotaxis protein